MQPGNKMRLTQIIFFAGCAALVPASGNAGMAGISDFFGTPGITLGLVLRFRQLQGRVLWVSVTDDGAWSLTLTHESGVRFHAPRLFTR